MTNILILGSGSREHAIAKTFLKNNFIHNIFISPGNKYISDENIKCLDIDKSNIIEFINNNSVSLVFIGSEKYLVEGYVDYLENINFFVPLYKNSMLEGSKIYANEIMNIFNLPTADYNVYTNYKDSFSNIINNPKSKVIKLDGLAGGKGVYLPNTIADARQILSKIYNDNDSVNNNVNASVNDSVNNNVNTSVNVSTDDSNRIIIEVRLYGEEVSLLGFCNGYEISFLPQSQDYKKYYNNDGGPNTGGMGSIAPVHILNDDQLMDIKMKIDNLVSYFNYKGILYIGLIVNSSGYNILEFNCRFGDPEAQVLLTLLESDLYSICINCIFGDELNIKWKDGYATNVVLSHNNYPYNKVNHLDISIGKLDNNIELYWGGSGRVVSMTSYNNSSLYTGLQMIYNNINKVNYGKYFRNDIGLQEYIKPSNNINRRMKIVY